MDAIPEGFEEHIPEWVNSFDDVSCKDIQELYSCDQLTQIMKTISPSHFDYTLLTGTSWEERASNFDSLVAGIEKFYEDELEREVKWKHPGREVDVEVLCRDQNIEELAKVIGAIVVAAVQCEDKETHIQEIMELSEAAQHTLFYFAQNAMEDSVATVDESVVEEMSQLKEANLKLQEEASLLNELKMENEKLQRKLDMLTQQQQTSGNSAKDNEEALRAVELKCEDLERSNGELQRKLDQSSESSRKIQERAQAEKSDLLMKERIRFENDIQKLQDEKDLLASKVTEFNTIKAREEKLREKIETLNQTVDSLKERLKQTEEANKKHVERIIELETRLEGIDSIEQRVEKYKNEALDLEAQRDELQSQLEVKDKDLVDLNNDLRDALDKVQYFEQVVEEQRQELEAHQEAGGDGLGAVAFGDDDDDVPLKLKEKLIRLEKENEKLKAAAASAPTSSATSDNSPSLHAKIEELERKLTEAQSKVSTQQALTLTTKNLRESVKTKETEIIKLQSEKEKLETYTKKALHNVQEKYMTAIRTCKDQIKEKDERIQKLQQSQKQVRAQSQRENQLLSSAIYELGMTIHEQRLTRTLEQRSKAKSSTWLQGKRDQVREGSLQG